MLTFLGDVYLPWHVQSNFRMEDPYVFNLEGSITTRNKENLGFNMKESLFQEVFGHNPRAVCLANNHVMDYGESGLRDTLTNLKELSIQFFGAGTLDENCHNPAILEINGFQVALLGYVCPSTHAIFVTENTPGVRPIDKAVINEDIRTAKKGGADRIIVHLHWGAEFVSLPKWEDIQIAEDIITMGADLIIGHHAHCIQPYQIWHGKPIYYGLGNCIFPFDERFETAVVSKRGKQKSLAVQYDLNTSCCRTFQLTFSNSKLYWQQEKKGSWNPAGSEKRYASRYRKAERMAIFRYLSTTFWNQPRLPRISTIREALLFGLRPTKRC